MVDQRAIDARIASAVLDEPYDAGDEADRSLRGGSRRYGMGEDGTHDASVTETSIAALRQLHERCGGWWRWHDDTTGADPSKPEEFGPRFVTTAEWREVSHG